MTEPIILRPVTYTVTIGEEDLDQVGDLDFEVTQRHLEVAAEVMAESQNFTQDLLDALLAAKYIVQGEQVTENVSNHD